jgi:hypothetical protein
MKKRETNIKIIRNKYNKKDNKENINENSLFLDNNYNNNINKFNKYNHNQIQIDKNKHNFYDVIKQKISKDIKIYNENNNNNNNNYNIENNYIIEKLPPRKVKIIILINEDIIYDNDNINNKNYIKKIGYSKERLISFDIFIEENILIKDLINISVKNFNLIFEEKALKYELKEEIDLNNNDINSLNIKENDNDMLYKIKVFNTKTERPGDYPCNNYKYKKIIFYYKLKY